MKNSASKVMRFYVASDGDDRWSGRKPSPGRSDGPFATLARARDAIREIKSRGDLEQPVVVAVRGGIHFLKETLVFAPADSGNAKCPILYTAYRDERVILSGGCRITGWTKAEKGLWSADGAHLQRRGIQVNQLFVDGRRAQRARQPVSGFFKVDKEDAGELSRVRFKFADGDLKPQWADGGTEIVIAQQWHTVRHTVESIDKSTRTLTAAGPSKWRVKHADYWLENCVGGLHMPGSWRWNRSIGRIYYRPIGEKDPNDSEMIVPCIETLIRFDGDPYGQNTVRHLEFSGLEFQHSAWSMGPDGYRDRQAAYNIGAAVCAEGTAHCAVKRCRFVHLGNYAIEWGGGCRNNEVNGCEITDVGGGGIKIGSPGARQGNVLSTASANTVEDSHIHDIGIVYPGAVGVWIGQSYGNKIVHNHIHDTYYSGISVGWTWGYGLSNTHHNTIAFNHIHHIGRGDMIYDMGAIYTLGIQPGTVIHHNLIHDVVSSKAEYARYGIYLDEGSSFIVCENNVVYRTQHAGFVQHFGRENIVRNNIFAMSDESQLRLVRAEAHRSFSMERNIICYDETPMGGIGGASNCAMDCNLYWCSDPRRRRNFRSLNLWLAQRQFEETLIAEAPRFDSVVVMPEASGAKASENPESRSFGTVPKLSFHGRFPDQAAWSTSLLLPELVTCTGKPASSIKMAETECHMLRDEAALFIRVHCIHSNICLPSAGGNSGQPEFVDIYLKPDISGDRIIQFIARADGSKETYYHPAGGKQKEVPWDAEIERIGTGWQAVLRVPFQSILSSCGSITPAWGIFIARFTVLPPMDFSEWQETGNDRHSLMADPLFANVRKGDFTLRPNSPAFKLGFKPIDLSSVGTKPRKG